MRDGLHPHRNRGKFKFTRALCPCGGAPGGRPGPSPYLDLTTVGPLEARLYRHWLCQENGVMSCLEGRAGDGAEQRSGGGPGGDGDSPGGGRGLRLLVGDPLPHEHRAMVLGGLSGGGRPVLLCLLHGRAPGVLPTLLPRRRRP